MSNFQKWFKAQFGALPNESRKEKLLKRRRELNFELIQLERRIDAEYRLSDQFTAALKSRTASESNYETNHKGD